MMCSFVFLFPPCLFPAPRLVILPSLHRTRMGRIDYRQDFWILREPPVGPHKQLPPFNKYKGRIGEWKEYKRIVHYPEDGKYTIKPLKTTKLAGRDPETGRKVKKENKRTLLRNCNWRRYHAFGVTLFKSSVSGAK